jgi:hypothetical protein
MSSKNHSIEAILEFASPIIDRSMFGHTFLSGLARNYQKILAEMDSTGRPFLLSVKGHPQGAILCSLQTYSELETKRRSLLSQFETVEQALKVEKINLADPLFVELQSSQEQIHRIQSEIKELTWTAQNALSTARTAKEELARERLRAASLRRKLKDRP